MDNFGGINGAPGQVPQAPQLDTTPAPAAQDPMAPAPTVQAPAMQDISAMPAMPSVAPPAPVFEDPYQATAPSFAPVEQPMPSFDQAVQPQQPLPDFGASSLSDVPIAAPNTGGNKRLITMVGVALVAVVALATVGFVGYTAGKSAGRAAALKEVQAQAAQQQQQEQSTDTSSEDTSTTAELKLGDPVDPEYKDETVEGAVGDQVTAADGLVLMVTNIERNFKPTDANYKLDATKELVKVNFLMGNIAKDKTKDVSNFNFRLENSTGAQLTPESISEYDGKFDTVKLDSGTQAKGSVVYAVNKDEKPLVFTRSQVYRITNQNREVTTKISIKIAE